MIAINNAALVAGLGVPPVNTVGYAPVYTYVADYTAKTITVTNDSVYPSGDSFKHANITLNGSQGETVYGVVTADNGNTGALSISTFDLVGPIKIKVVELTTLGCIGVGISPDVLPNALTGSLGNYEISFTTAAGI